jgi:hypothetical protein
VNNSRSNVYRGDFRKRKKALRAIHARQSAYCGDLWKHAKATCRLIHVLIRMFRRLPYTESTGFHIWHPPVAIYGHPLMRCRLLSLRLLFPCGKSAVSSLRVITYYLNMVARHSSITSDESHLHFFYWGKSILID